MTQRTLFDTEPEVIDNAWALEDDDTYTADDWELLSEWSDEELAEMSDGGAGLLARKAEFERLHPVPKPTCRWCGGNNCRHCRGGLA